MKLLDLGCGSGAAADYLACRRNVEILCVTNSEIQANICRRKFQKFGGRVHATVADFDCLDLPMEGFDGIYALESIGYTKDLDAWLERCWRTLKPGGRLLIRSPGSLDHCRREHDYQSVTVFFKIGGTFLLAPIFLSSKHAGWVSTPSTIGDYRSAPGG
jgi:cyclopropane fatty-acyl-phospholipid synthase-like methyltransferase